MLIITLKTLAGKTYYYYYNRCQLLLLRKLDSEFFRVKTLCLTQRSSQEHHILFRDEFLNHLGKKKLFKLVIKAKDQLLCSMNSQGRRLLGCKLAVFN